MTLSETTTSSTGYCSEVLHHLSLGSCADKKQLRTCGLVMAGYESVIVVNFFT